MTQPREFEIRARSSYSSKTKIGNWSAAIREPANTKFRRIALSGEIKSSNPDKPELTAAIESLKNLPENSGVFFETCCSYFYEGVTQRIREVPDSPLWKELDCLAEERKIFWKLAPKGDVQSKIKRVESDALLEQRRLHTEKTKDHSKRVNRQQKQDWCVRYRHNESINQIAELECVQRRTVIRALREQNLFPQLVKREASKYTPELRKHWVKLYQANHNLKQISDEAGCSRETVARELIRRGVHVRHTVPEVRKRRDHMARIAYRLRAEEKLLWEEIQDELGDVAYDIQNSGTIRRITQHYAQTQGLDWPIAVKREPVRKECSLDSCNRVASSKGLCNLHYNRQIWGQPLDAPIRRRTVSAYPKGAICSYKDCPRPVKCLNLCRSHYERVQNGSKLEGPIQKRRPRKQCNP